MADSVSFEIHGVDALTAKLDSVVYDVKRKGGRFALRKSANLIRDDAQQRAALLNDPKTDENIADNIAVRWNGKRFKQTGDLMFRVGVMGGAKEGDPNVSLPGGDTWYWRLLEFGTEKMGAQPFLRPALAQNIQAATTEFVTQYDKAIDRAIRRAAKQAGNS